MPVQVIFVYFFVAGESSFAKTLIWTIFSNDGADEMKTDGLKIAKEEASNSLAKINKE